MNVSKVQGSTIQNGTVTYSVNGDSAFGAAISKMVSDENESDPGSMSGILGFVKKFVNAIAPVTYRLEIQGNTSKFEIVSPPDQDESSMMNMNRINAQIIGTIYINESDKRILQHRKVYDEDYYIAYGVDAYEWNITEERKVINGYDCIKATCKRLKASKSKKSIEAWFSPEITNAIGPQGYGGLPGLILELTTNGMTTYRASDIVQGMATTAELEIPEPQQTYGITVFSEVLKVLMEENKDGGALL